MKVSCTIDLLDERLGILDRGSDRDPSFIHRLREIHGGDNVGDEQKYARLSERSAGTPSATEPKHRVNLASGFRVHLSPEPIRHELFWFWVEFFIPCNGPAHTDQL